MFKYREGHGQQGQRGIDANTGAAPGKRTLVEGLVQRRANGVGDAERGGEIGGGARGDGAAMPGEVRAKMERSFGADFSAVRIHQDDRAEALSALAYTSGTDIHMAPGQYDPHSEKGQELLGHELAHVVQQSQGRVKPTMQAKGVDINDDRGLEQEADAMGARAARGEPASRAAAGNALAPLPRITLGAISRKAVVQRLINDEDVPVIDSLGTSLREDRSGESSLVAGTLIYEQGGKSHSLELGVFDNSFQRASGKYTTHAYEIDSKKGHDAEPKLLDLLDLKLELLMLQGGPITKGTLHLRGTRGPCNRCQGVLQKFQQAYPSIEVKSYYEQSGRVESSNIENTKGKGTYENGYKSAVPARSAFVGQVGSDSLDILWYKHLQSQDDKEKGIDPREELRKQYVEQQELERRASFVQKVQERRDQIFYNQTSGMTVVETHVLLADKVRPRKGTATQYGSGLGLPLAPVLDEIHPGLVLTWTVQSQVQVGQSARLVGKVTYPGTSVYEQKYEAVGTKLATEGLAEGFTYHERTKLEPNLGAMRTSFNNRLDAYLEQVLRGEHDDGLKWFDGRLQYDTLPSFVL